jgi:hypothetical protein
VTALLSSVPDPVIAAAQTLAIGEWTNWGQRPVESWDLLDDKAQLVEITDQLMKARWLLAQRNGFTDPTVRAS